MSRSILHGDPPTTELLREIIEVEHIRSLWGVPHRVTPRLVEEVFGDGRQLLGITPIDTRPNYYLVRVDSSWDLDDEIREHIDYILAGIEDEYGGTSCDCDGDHVEGSTGCPYDDEFPALRDESGVSWFGAEWPAEVIQ